MKDFSLKFIDIMIGVVLGLGFQWWTALSHPWQYVAFIFAYLDIVDYWIDYSPSLKKFPPKREIDVFIDLGIMFALFLYIYTTQLTVVFFFGAFIVWRVLDFFWLLSSRAEFRPAGRDRVFLDTWIQFNVLEAFATGGLLFASLHTAFPPLLWVLSYILLRVLVRIAASFRYKKVHFV